MFDCSLLCCKTQDKNKPKFPNALKKGFASAFNKFDSYQIAKYKNSNKEVKLVDIINNLDEYFDIQ